MKQKKIDFRWLKQLSNNHYLQMLNNCQSIIGMGEGLQELYADDVRYFCCMARTVGVADIDSVIEPMPKLQGNYWQIWGAEFYSYKRLRYTRLSRTLRYILRRTYIESVEYLGKTLIEAYRRKLGQVLVGTADFDAEIWANAANCEELIDNCGGLLFELLKQRNDLDTRALAGVLLNEKMVNYLIDKGRQNEIIEVIENNFEAFGKTKVQGHIKRIFRRYEIWTKLIKIASAKR